MGTSESEVIRVEERREAEALFEAATGEPLTFSASNRFNYKSIVAGGNGAC